MVLGWAKPGRLFYVFFLFFGESGGRSQIIVWKGERLFFIGQFLERVVSLWRRGGYDGMYVLPIGS